MSDIKTNLSNKLFKKIDDLSKNIMEKEIIEVAKIFIDIKKLSNNVLLFKTETDDKLEKVLSLYISKKGFDYIGKLAQILKSSNSDF
jgi:hypothetical protein